LSELKNTGGKGGAPWARRHYTASWP
jgi:hypothetical protein